MMKKQKLMNNYAEGAISAIIVILSIAAISVSAAISFDPLADVNILSAFNNENKEIPVVAPIEKRSSEAILYTNDGPNLLNLPDSVKTRKITIKNGI